MTFDPVGPLLSNSTRLRTVRRANATQIALIDSTDDGATWSDRTQIDSSLVFRAGLMKADGSTLFALSAATGIGHQVLAVHTAPDGTLHLDPIVPFTPPAT